MEGKTMGSNIVQLKPATGRKPRATRDDAKLIRACIEFAAAVAALDAACAIDRRDGPPADILARLCRQWQAALRFAAHSRAMTIEGVQAKARIMPMLVAMSAGSIIPDAPAFFRTFAADADRLLDPLVRERGGFAPPA
jgi:hypothetical protein